MGLNSGVRVDRVNELIARFTYDADRLPETIGGAMAMAATRGAEAMGNRIATAATITGEKRRARGGNGPGRVKTAAMIRSRFENGQPFRLDFTESRVGVEFGYIGFDRADNERERAQIQAQEYEYYSISGQLNALQIGFNLFQAHIHDDIALAWYELDNDAAAGRFRRRGYKALIRARELNAVATGSAPGVIKRKRGRPKKVK